MITLGGDTFISNLSDKKCSILHFLFLSLELRSLFYATTFYGKVCLCPVLPWFPCSSEISFEAVFRCFYAASKISRV